MFLKDIGTKDDPEFKFDDDDDDSMLAAVLPDSVTKPAENSSSAVSGNPVQRLPSSTQTEPHPSSQASQLPQHNTADPHPTSQASQLPQPNTADPHPSSQAGQLPQPNTADPHPSSQASQLPQYNTDHGPGESGHTGIPEGGTCFQDLFHEGKIETSSLRVLSVYFIFQTCDKKIIAPKEDMSFKSSPFKVLVMATPNT